MKRSDQSLKTDFQVSTGNAFLMFFFVLAGVSIRGDAKNICA